MTNEERDALILATANAVRYIHLRVGSNYFNNTFDERLYDHYKPEREAYEHLENLLEGTVEYTGGGTRTSEIPRAAIHDET